MAMTQAMMSSHFFMPPIIVADCGGCEATEGPENGSPLGKEPP